MLLNYGIFLKTNEAANTSKQHDTPDETKIFLLLTKRFQTTWFKHWVRIDLT